MAGPARALPWADMPVACICCRETGLALFDVLTAGRISRRHAAAGVSPNHAGASARHGRLGHGVLREPRTDVVIIGGGIHGCGPRLLSGRRGLSAIVIEKPASASTPLAAAPAAWRQLGRDFAEIPALPWPAMELCTSCRPDRQRRASTLGQVRVAENDADMAMLEGREAECGRAATA